MIIKLCFERRSRVLLLLIGLLVGIGQAATAAPTPNRAGLVIRFSDGSVQTACIAFEEASITGFELLQRSGLPVTAEASAGSATVCKIQNEGCAFPAEPCFCRCTGGGPCSYWSYWHLTGAGWQFSNVGAPSYRVQPGTVDGWSWGSGSGSGGSQPPALSFADICPAPTAVPPTPIPPPAEPTAIPPTRPKPTAAPPTRRPATATRSPAPAPTLAPAQATTVPSPSPSLTPEPPTLRPSASPSSSPSPTPLVPTATASPTASMLPTSTATPTPAVTPRPPGTSWLNYAAFGVLCVGLLVGWGFVRRRPA